MFLLIAPPSVGVVSLDFLNDLVDGATEFSPFSEMLLGWVFVLLLLLIRMCPTIWRSPSVLGEYWAYGASMGAVRSYYDPLYLMSHEI